MLARQLRLRLVAVDGSDIPRNCSNIIVSIHAIATFQALNDYLRPRISGLLGGMGGSRLSGMLAALAASGIPTSSLARNGTGVGAGGSSSSQAPALAAGTSASVGTSASAPAAESSAAAGLGRRRSLRLSAKSAGSFSSSAHAATVVANPTDASAPDPPASETAVNEDEDVRDEFPEDDYEAEVRYYCINLTLLTRGRRFRCSRMM